MSDCFLVTALGINIFCLRYPCERFDIYELVDTEFIQMSSGEYSDDDSYGATYPQSNNSREYSDDESYDDRGTNYSKFNSSQEYSDDESYDDSGESEAKSEEYSDDDSYALGDYNTTHSGSKATSNRVSVQQQTCRLKNEDKQSGSYERFTTKDKTVSGEPFVDRHGNRGYKDERTTTSTYKTGDRSGYTEYSREEKVKHVDYNKSSNHKSVKSYSKNSKH